MDRQVVPGSMQMAKSAGGTPDNADLAVACACQLSEPAGHDILEPWSCLT